MMDLAFRVATPADAAALAALGERTFRGTFGPANDPADIDAYCAETYGIELQRREITDPARHIVLAYAGDTLVGYAQLSDGHRFACVTGPAPIEVLRFYVDAPWHGRGVASRLMAETVSAAVARGARTMYLAVWEHNPRAIAFYARQGFVRVGTTTFTLGKDVQTDHVLARPIAPAKTIAPVDAHGSSMR
jgi:GNAT superfamily N-acetyltransferase